MSALNNEQREKAPSSLVAKQTILPIDLYDPTNSMVSKTSVTNHDTLWSL
jgi:hypothetical protein